MEIFQVGDSRDYLETEEREFRYDEEIKTITEE
jgi:hypothetical protein